MDGWLGFGAWFLWINVWKCFTGGSIAVLVVLP
jgi:hypothetical protein